MNDRLLYRIPEVAEILGIGRSKAYELVRTGQLKSVRIDGARHVAGEDLRAFVAAPLGAAA